MRALVLCLLLCAACQEDPGVLVDRKDGGGFMRHDAGEAGADGSP
jgi:hypothetical protein